MPTLGCPVSGDGDGREFVPDDACIGAIVDAAIYAIAARAVERARACGHLVDAFQVNSELSKIVQKGVKGVLFEAGVVASDDI